jgi:hypothetical protein
MSTRRFNLSTQINSIYVGFNYLSDRIFGPTGERASRKVGFAVKSPGTDPAAGYFTEITVSRKVGAKNEVGVRQNRRTQRPTLGKSVSQSTLLESYSPDARKDP